ncbi:MAG: hypothetical protein B0D92_00635, partial [Spirochaeta sp. LUC14_002_19_P3]
MRIIKPYGRSVTEENERKLMETRLDDPVPIKNLKNKPEFIIVQWISTIDKIIRKPKGHGKPAENQYKLREDLGKAVWKVIQNKKLLGCTDYSDGGPRHKAWKRRIHPYKKPYGRSDSENMQTNNTESAGQENIRDVYKGRWYKSFAGDIEWDAAEIANRIYQHLYEKRRTLNPENSKANTNQGKIAAQLNAVEKSVIKKNTDKQDALGESISEESFDTYISKTDGDIAKNIFDEAKEKKVITGKNNREQEVDKNQTDCKKIIFSHLYAHYANVFGPAKIEEVKTGKDKKELFAVHEQVKSAYKAVLSHSNFKPVRLPHNNTQLYHLILARQKNQDIASQIRLGKIIHYTAENPDQLPPPNVIKNSCYWLSDGQAEIKRNEALVRIWKQVICFANHSLCLWAGKTTNEDIFTGAVDKHIEANPEAQRQQAEKLFGNDIAERMPQTNPNYEELIRYAIDSWKNLRNNSFHFKNKQQFLESLKNTEKEVPEQVQFLWKKDCKKRDNRIIDTLKSLKCQDYIPHDSLTKIYEAVREPAMNNLPLPRFSRLFKNHDFYKSLKLELRLPLPINTDKLNANPALKCRYEVIKLLYERKFPDWIDENPNQFKDFIEIAYKRSNDAAQKINKGQSRAKKIYAEIQNNTDSKAISTLFLQLLSAATATEFQVQQGYSHNSEQARKQSEYIEKFKLEVFVRAFDAFLSKEWNFLLCDLQEKTTKASLPEVQSMAHDAEEWQKRLYFMLYMVPVNAVSSLLHQLKKWDTLTLKAPQKKTQNEKTQNEKNLMESCNMVMALYLDMHDSHFDGGAEMEVPEELKPLFEKEKLPNIYWADNTSTALPLRGLRELLRFGFNNKLLPIFKNNKITQADLNTMDENNISKIEAAHKKQAELHEKWVTKKKLFGEDDKEYKQALNTIIAYRTASAQARFTNHLKLYHLTMTVLARLADYAGLWERDLYFVSLAVMYQNEEDWEKFKGGKGWEEFKGGQIVCALRELNKTICEKNASICKKIASCYQTGDLSDLINGNPVSIRNALSHLNMLRNSDPLELTHWVNQTRILMAYDRKLKNAVSHSIKKLLLREGIVIHWNMSPGNNEHILSGARIHSKSIKHLNGKGPVEKLNSDAFCKMVAELFGAALNLRDTAK